MNWIKIKLPQELPVKNFTTDWNDGKAIGALVDAVAPGLCPDWEVSFQKKKRFNFVKNHFVNRARYLKIQEI